MSSHHKVPLRYPVVLYFVLLSSLTVTSAADNAARAAHQTWIIAVERGARESISNLKPQHVRKLNDFGLQLFARLDSAKGDNVVISPPSIASVLTMLILGVTKGSNSEKELRSLIGKGFSSPGGATDPAVEFKAANSIWTTNLVLRGYENRVKRAFDAKVCPLPSEVAVINNWVSDATNGNIPSILDKIPVNTVAILINAIFFKAAWKIQFDPKDTRDEDFFGPKGETASPVVTTVKMMRLEKVRVPYAEVPLSGRDSVQVFELPYGKGEEYAATIVVPTGLTTLEEILQPFRGGSTRAWNKWIQALRETELDLLSLPRFRIEFGVVSLVTTLQDMGLNAPFSSDRLNPQLLRLAPNKEAFVSDILHKATLEVTENGTEASAVTAGIVELRGLRPKIEVIVNRPFLFAIRNVKSGALLFIAKIDRP